MPDFISKTTIFEINFFMSSNPCGRKAKYFSLILFCRTQNDAKWDPKKLWENCEPGGIRTRDQELKRLLLYR